MVKPTRSAFSVLVDIMAHNMALKTAPPANHSKTSPYNFNSAIDISPITMQTTIKTTVARGKPYATRMNRPYKILSILHSLPTQAQREQVLPVPLCCLVDFVAGRWALHIFSENLQDGLRNLSGIYNNSETCRGVFKNFA